MRADDFDAAAGKAAAHVLGRLGKRKNFPVRYKREAREYVEVVQRDGTRSLAVTAMRREDVADLETDSGVAIVHGVVYDLLTAEIGKAKEGDLIEDTAHGSFEVLRTLIDDGSTITVLVGLSNDSNLRAAS